MLNANDYQLLDLVVQRGVIDTTFRQRLLAFPQQTLHEAGLLTEGLTINVLECDEDKVILLLPPPMALPSWGETATGSGAGSFSELTRHSFSDQPPSPPLRGVATTALANLADNRATLGVSVPSPSVGGA